MLKKAFNPSEDKPSLSIRHRDLVNIFQLGNEDSFDLYKKDEIDADTFSLIGSILDSAKSPATPHFEKKSRLKDLTVKLASEETGGLMLWIDYTLKDEPAPKTINRSVAIIAQIIPNPSNEDDGHFEVHFLMSGQTTESEDHSHYTPNEVLCRYVPSESNDAAFAVAITDTSVKASFCYAEEASKTIMAGLPLNEIANESWLYEENRGQAIHRFDALTKRTPEEFEAELWDKQNEKSREIQAQTYDDGNSHQFYANPGLNMIH